MKSKQIILFMLALIMLFSGRLNAKDSNKKIKIIDWKGKELGAEIPQWVINATMGLNEDAKQNLGIADSKKAFFAFGQQEKLEIAFILSKINCFESIIETIRKAEKSMMYESTAGVTSNTIVSPTMYLEETNGANGYSMHKESYTPFGYHKLSVKDGKIISEIISEEVIIPKDVDEKEWIKQYGWFCNPQNVQMNQFWIKYEMSNEKNYYDVITLMSISETDWKQITQSFVKKIDSPNADRETRRFDLPKATYSIILNFSQSLGGHREIFPRKTPYPSLAE